MWTQYRHIIHSSHTECKQFKQLRVYLDGKEINGICGVHFEIGMGLLEMYPKVTI